MRFRQKFLGFSGGTMVSMGLGLLILGKDTAYLEAMNVAGAATYVNGGAGVPMWTGLVVILCGMANIVQAFEKGKKPGRAYYELPFSMTVFLSNFAALAVTAVCMGILSWSLYPVYLEPTLVENAFHQSVVGLYATIIVACCLIFIFALMTMFIDCCINGFIGFGGPMGMPPPEFALICIACCINGFIGFGGPMRMSPPDHGHRESPYDTYAGRPAMLYK